MSLLDAPQRSRMGVEAATALVGAVAAKDEGALDALVAHLNDVVLRRVRRRIARAPVAGYGEADLVQEVWLRLLERDARQICRWRSERGASLEGYVAMIVDREIGNLRQRAAAAKRRAHHVALDEVPVVAEARSPERVLLQRERLANTVDRLFATLSPRGHDVLRALFEEELDPDAVARRLCIRRQSVYAWRHRIRAIARTHEENSRSR